ncbi:hypothetical protein ACQBAR_04855 [Propionibacteriaceae bacterium Y1685]
MSHGSASNHLILAWLGVPVEAAAGSFIPLTAGGISTLVRSESHRSNNLVTLNATAHLS